MNTKLGPTLVWMVWAFVVVCTAGALIFGVSFANDVKNCQREFNSALQARSKLSVENERLASIEREALRNWIGKLLAPPAPYNTMDINDPLRQKYGLEITKIYFKTVEETQKQRQANEVERKKNPLPDPTCGK